MTSKHRNYENDYPSVTTIIGVLRSIALEQWFKVNTLEFINKESGKGRAIGTSIHKAIENYITTGQATVETEYIEEVTCALHSFVKFRKERPDIFLKWSEAKCTSNIYKYNGTIDCIAQTDKDLVLPNLLLDWKSGKAGDKDKPDIYDNYKIQVAAYVYLYNEVHGCDIKEAIIVSIAKDKVAYNTHTMNEDEIKEYFEEEFLSCLRIYNHQHNNKGE